MQSVEAQTTDHEKTNSGEIRLRNTTNINSTHLEFSPAYYQNGIVFASSQKAGKKDKNIDETFFELFYSETDPNGEPLKARPFSMRVNSFLHEGPVTFDREGKKIFFTRNNIKKGLQKADSKKVTRLKIYQAEKGLYDWENIIELPFNDDEFSCAHPTLSADGTQLYFASDRPGGFGGMDIWVVKKNGNYWGEPENLGGDVNTSANEVFPFIHNSGNLFFASNGHGGEGGLDVFMVNVDAESFQIWNLEKPFNTTHDDLGLILNANGKSGYFASNRHGGVGKDDIYYFEAPNGIFGATVAKTIASTISVIDARNNNSIEGAAIRIFQKSKDGFLSGNNNLYEAVLMPTEEGAKELVFKLIRKDESLLGEPDRISDENGKTEFTFDGEKEYLIVVTKEGFSPKEIMYSTIGNDIKNVIQIRLEKPTCALITGVVLNKIDNKPIPNSIVKIRNSCSGKEVELFTNEKAEFEYCAAYDCDFTIKAIKENYKSDFVKIIGDDLNRPNLHRKILMTPVYGGPSIGAGTLIVLENIYYDFNKSAIRIGAAQELDGLVHMMKQYPSMVIELASHTDSRGEANYNIKLSRARAESAKQYLISKGIASERVRAVGYGEAQPRNKCVDYVKCTEEEYQFNRRTEVKVISIDAPVNIRYGNNAPEVIDRKRAKK